MKHFIAFASGSALIVALTGFGEPTRAAHAEPPPSDDACDAVWYADVDHDGYGIVDAAVVACHAPDGFAALPGDCDDVDAGVHPLAGETCNGRDDDCDGQTDDVVPVWYRDGDGDGWGDPANTWARCDRPDGYAPRGGDCDDRDRARFTGRGCPR